MAREEQPRSIPPHRRENVVTGRFGNVGPIGDPAPDNDAPRGGTGSAARDPTEPSEAILRAAIALGCRPLPSGREVLADAYFDTRAFDLLRSGLALRLRGSDVRVHVTVESLDRPGFDDLEAQRFEVGGPVEDVSRPLDPDSWPEAVRQRVQESTGRAPRLVPLCVLHQRREKIPLVSRADGEGPVVAALNLDVVDVFDPRDVPGDRSLHAVAHLLEDGAPVVTFTELDVEPLAEGAMALLDRLRTEMATIPDAAPVASGKLEQALRVLADRPARSSRGAIGISSGMSMAEAGRLLERRHLLAMLLNEAGVRRGKDIEYVHDMRVATRRARAAARLFGPFLRPKAPKVHFQSLRRTARALGAVRDADVALRGLRRYSRNRPPEEQQALAEIRAVWRVERRQAHRALIGWLDSQDYRAFVTSFFEQCWSAGPEDREGDARHVASPEPSEVGHVVPSAILRRFERVRAYEPLFESSEPVPIASLHALRIDCKSLRYSLEPVRELLGEEGGEVIRRLQKVQDLLGDLHDAALADGRLAPLDDIVAPVALATFRAHQQSVLTDLAAAAASAWRELVAPDNRMRLACAISRL